jgi:hypothetical protein
MERRNGLAVGRGSAGSTRRDDGTALGAATAGAMLGPVVGAVARAVGPGFAFGFIAAVAFVMLLVALLPAGSWKGTVEPTVDHTKHVNGGCRSLNADGTHWRCYVGDEAVKQQIIGSALLGEFSPAPGQG